MANYAHLAYEKDTTQLTNGKLSKPCDELMKQVLNTHNTNMIQR